MRLVKLFSLILVITLSACGSIAAQTDAGLNQVTLYWFSFGQIIHTDKTDPSRSSVNFETGRRGGNSPGLDLRYGGMIIGMPAQHGKPDKLFPDWLGALDCRSMIVDLGAKQWRDFKETPPLPQPKTLAPPRPLSRPDCVIDASAGRTDFSPYRQHVVPDPGHVYLMRLLREHKVIYVMFRVESLVSQDHCVLSWKLVKPPNVDNEAF
jgi:hypothetical protein